jgi:hypothetical protein
MLQTALSRTLRMMSLHKCFAISFATAGGQNLRGKLRPNFCKGMLPSLVSKGQSTESFVEGAFLFPGSQKRHLHSRQRDSQQARHGRSLPSLVSMDRTRICWKDSSPTFVEEFVCISTATLPTNPCGPCFLPLIGADSGRGKRTGAPRQSSPRVVWAHGAILLPRLDCASHFSFLLHTKPKT